MQIYLELFYAFFKIGLFGFGGGYAMLPLIQQEVVHNYDNWLTMTEFTDIVAISQMSPGPIAINSATYIGYKVTESIFGSLVATFSVCLPPLLIMLIISKFYLHFKNNQYFLNAMKGIKPAVIGLIASAAVLLMNEDNFADLYSIAIFIAVFITSIKKINPIYLIVISGLSGVFLYW